MLDGVKIRGFYSRMERDNHSGNIEITPEMIAAGEDAILCVVGGADLGGFFSARDLAERVFLAMKSARESH